MHTITHMQIATHTHTHTQTHGHSLTYTHTHRHIVNHSHTHTQSQPFTYTHTHTHTHTHKLILIHPQCGYKIWNHWQPNIKQLSIPFSKLATHQNICLMWPQIVYNFNSGSLDLVQPTAFRDSKTDVALIWLQPGPNLALIRHRSAAVSCVG